MSGVRFYWSFEKARLTQVEDRIVSGLILIERRKIIRTDGNPPPDPSSVAEWDSSRGAGLVSRSRYLAAVVYLPNPLAGVDEATCMRT